LRHSVISSTTFSVIREIVSLETFAPETSAKCAATSPVVNPRAVSESTIWSTPSNPPLPLAHDLRVEAAVPIPRDLDLDRTDLGEHPLRPNAVAGVAASAADRVVPVIARGGR
jgi:hypothetical protein